MRQCGNSDYLNANMKYQSTEEDFSLQWRHFGRDSVSNHQPHDCLRNRLFRRRSKKTSNLRVTGLCVWNSPGTGEFAQMASNAENVSIWWHHHVTGFHVTLMQELPLPIWAWDAICVQSNNRTSLYYKDVPQNRGKPSEEWTAEHGRYMMKHGGNVMKAWRPSLEHETSYYLKSLPCITRALKWYICFYIWHYWIENIKCLHPCQPTRSTRSNDIDFSDVIHVTSCNNSVIISIVLTTWLCSTNRADFRFATSQWRNCVPLKRRLSSAGRKPRIQYFLNSYSVHCSIATTMQSGQVGVRRVYVVFSSGVSLITSGSRHCCMWWCR